ncbi:MAG: lipoyl synthase [Desulfobulbaceae bacterium]|nr:lipoyl synthase [Desulfobulbaceae bacterium]
MLISSPVKCGRSTKPSWLRVRLPSGEESGRVADLLRGHDLHSVCVKARCPNRGECWQRGTATFLIMGDICTRNCRFCAVRSGEPLPLDQKEAQRLAAAVKDMGLRHVVVTSVTRDDLEDGGASCYAQVILLLHERCPPCTVEVLIPDFGGGVQALEMVLEARPHILSHNLETVPRLYGKVRPGASYERSLGILKGAKGYSGRILVKSGLMLGLGETAQEVESVMSALREVGCDIVTLGQYLQPSKKHLPVVRYLEPGEFETFKRKGMGMGFQHIEAGPLVRSSYHAENVLWKG